MKHVDIIVPIYNEQDNVGCLTTAVHQVMEGLPYTYSMILVDDGSTDKTLEVIRALAAADPRIKYLSFSRNFGHQNALKSGLDHSTGDCAISMDGDMQHPPELIPVLLQKWEEGYDVVYTIRVEDEKHTGFFKRTASDQFYKVMNYLSGLNLEQGSADFRLVSKQIVDVIKGLTESELFFRGLVKWLGFRQFGVEYRSNPRKTGRSKYTIKKMVRLGLQGITAFSTRPLYFAAYLGFTFSCISLLYIPYALISYYFGHTLSGWTSIIVSIAFFGGLQLCLLGVVGLYLGKVFMQAKHRPLYILKESNI